MSVNNFSDIIDLFTSIEKISSTNDKIDILSKYKDDVNVKRVLEIAINPYIVTHISETLIDHIRSNMKTNTIVFTDTSDIISGLFVIENELVSRIISGTILIDRVASFLNFANTIDPRASIWIERILSKKLRIGISEKNLMTAMDITIRPATLQTAEDTYKLNENCESLLNDIDNWIMQPKLDGFRYILVFTNDEVKFISRSGREKDQSMYPTLRKLLMEQYNKLEGYALDCEITATDWNDTASILQSTKNKKDDSNIKINVFDILTINDLYNKTCNIPLYQRQLILESDLLQEVPGRIEKVKSFKAESRDHILKIFKEYTSRGGEGLMLKDLNSTYKFKRSKDWLKVKQIMSEDLRCIDMYEGKGKNIGRLGGIIVVVQDDPVITCNVGGGFSEEQMEYYWNNRSEILNHIVEIEYRTKTKDGNLRHPIFLRVRTDKE